MGIHCFVASVTLRCSIELDRIPLFYCDFRQEGERSVALWDTESPSRTGLDRVHTRAHAEERVLAISRT